MTERRTASESTVAERVKGAAKRVAGAVTGNDALRHEGELHDRKADSLRDARRLEAEAVERERGAELAARAQAVDAEREQLAAEERADAERDQIARERRDAGRAIGQDAAQRVAAADAQRAAERHGADAAEIAAAREHAAATHDADAIEQAAEDARAEARALDAAARIDDEPAR